MKRWEPSARYIGTGEYVADMQKDSDGDYVLYEDAKAEIERLRALLLATRERMQNYGVDTYDIDAALKEQE